VVRVSHHPTLSTLVKAVLTEGLRGIDDSEREKQGTGRRIWRLASTCWPPRLQHAKHAGRGETGWQL